MEVSTTCDRLRMLITGLSQLREVRIRIRPITTCQKIHSRKLPSWPSQKQDIMKCTGRLREECCQA